MALEHGTGPIWLLQKLPPPYGGGELYSQWVRDYLKTDRRFCLVRLPSAGECKRDQGRPTAGKLWSTVRMLIRLRRRSARTPAVVAGISVPRSVLALVRDCMFLRAVSTARTTWAGELHGGSLEVLQAPDCLARQIAGKLLRKFRAIRVLGQGIREDVSNALQGQQIEVTVIENGVPDPGADYVRLSRSPRSIVFVGALSREKGIFDLLHAYSILRRSYPDATLHCVGEWISPRDRDEFETAARRSGLANGIVMHGRLLGPQKYDIMSSASVLALPSYREGQPLVLLEALSVGTPLVAYSIGAIPDIFRKGPVGATCRPGCPEELALAIENVWTRVTKGTLTPRVVRRVYDQFYRIETSASRLSSWYIELARAVCYDHAERRHDVS